VRKPKKTTREDTCGDFPAEREGHLFMTTSLCFRVSHPLCLFLFLPLPCPTEKTSVFEDVVNTMFQPAEVEARCEICSGKSQDDVPKLKKIEIVSFPHILILQLSDYAYDMHRTRCILLPLLLCSTLRFLEHVSFFFLFFLFLMRNGFHYSLEHISHSTPLPFCFEPHQKNRNRAIGERPGVSFLFPTRVRNLVHF